MILCFSVSEHSKHPNEVVDFSIAQMISAEYEQDCFHYVLSEMQIGDKDEVSWKKCDSAIGVGIIIVLQMNQI